MNTTFLILLLVILLILAWLSHLRIRETAVTTAYRTCSEQGLQFLDGTAALRRSRFVFSRKNGPGLESTFTFDYSSDGIGRRTGCVILVNTQVTTVLLDE